ncbi:serpin family protein [Glycomyces paridis]|uniref:Proteinase inhibitor I4 serpin n=1 Tax=Glycomyces paridis TaxID=2126555 RepID=A0A4S8PME0_9ACTN|nr:serpin family protein [Glycomyces paridis]THV30895.1 proteinase inhibitor I4 serpin [Glycomyces paridis]
MGTSDLQQALTTDELHAANRLTRAWLEDLPELPAALSGLGLWPLLAVLATGASGPTRSELATAAGIRSDRLAAAPAALLAAVADSPALRLAVGVWAGSRVTLDPDWTATLPVDAVGSLTGDRAADKAALDAWASRNTRGLIPAMPLDFERPVDLVLASALSVRTTWTTPFQDVTRTFTTGPWAALGRCRGLTTTLPGAVLRVTDRVSVLTVPGDGDIDVLLAIGRDGLAPHLTMSALLTAAADPSWGRPGADLAAGERAAGVEVAEYRAMRPQTDTETGVETVRFDLGSEFDLTEHARPLGLAQACDPDLARFDRLAAEPVYVSQARQTCKAVFSATGFEAAAVTAIAMARAAGAPRLDHRHLRATIRFDRPFAYLARHRPTGLVLVAGWVAEPERA